MKKATEVQTWWLFVWAFHVNKKRLVLVGRAGFEPATNGLKVRCSTN
jgi:hypothetical protein